MSTVRHFLFTRVNLHHGKSQTEDDPVGTHSNYPPDILDQNLGATVQPSVSMHPTPFNLLLFPQKTGPMFQSRHYVSATEEEIGHDTRLVRRIRGLTGSPSFCCVNISRINHWPSHIVGVIPREVVKERVLPAV